MSRIGKADCIMRVMSIYFDVTYVELKSSHLSYIIIQPGEKPALFRPTCGEFVYKFYDDFETHGVKAILVNMPHSIC